MGAARLAAAAAACALLVVLAACGLPAGTPERLAVQPAYPAVHDMPPPRDARMLDEDQQERLEKDLIATRDRQSKQKKAK